jgi:hypothetical protein
MLAQHTITCAGAIQAAAQAQSRTAARQILSTYLNEREEVGDKTTPNIEFGLQQLTALPLFAEFMDWLSEPLLGYESTGGQRRVRSSRTVSIIKEDLLCVMRHLPPSEQQNILALTNDSTVTATLKCIAKKIAGPSRFYNILSACAKLNLFFKTVYKIEATALPLLQTLTRQYNAMR